MNMKEFLGFLEQMEFSVWVRESGTIWEFPMILFVHTLGMSIVAGGSAMLSLIVLGFWPALPIKPFARLFHDGPEHDVGGAAAGEDREAGVDRSAAHFQAGRSQGQAVGHRAAPAALVQTRRARGRSKRRDVRPVGLLRIERDRGDHTM